MFSARGGLDWIRGHPENGHPEHNPLTTSYDETVSAFKRILEVDEDDVLLMLEEGRLTGALISTLRSRGKRATPTMKNSVEKAVRALRTRGDAPAETTSESPAEAGTTPSRDLLSSEMTVTIMFTDVVGSTAMNRRLGDRNARKVMRDHDRLVRVRTSEHGGVEVKSMGDGFMLTFPSAKSALSAGIAIQRSLVDPDFNHRDSGLSIRMGLTVGEPIREEQDLFGMAVATATRIGDRAGGGQILVSQIVHDLLLGTGQFRFETAGKHPLKGVPGRHKLYAVVWREE